MLGVRSYTQEYIDGCRSRVESDLLAYRSLVAAEGSQHDSDKKRINEAFEARFFNNMVLILDYLFVHRLRTVEGKDGNPLTEVRILSNSIANNNNIMTAENASGMVAFAGLNAIKLDPMRSVLKLQFGDEIEVTESDFERLSRAFFAEIERKFR